MIDATTPAWLAPGYSRPAAPAVRAPGEGRGFVALMEATQDPAPSAGPLGGRDRPPGEADAAADPAPRGEEESSPGDAVPVMTPAPLEARPERSRVPDPEGDGSGGIEAACWAGAPGILASSGPAPLRAGIDPGLQAAMRRMADAIDPPPAAQGAGDVAPWAAAMPDAEGDPLPENAGGAEGRWRLAGVPAKGAFETRDGLAGTTPLAPAEPQGDLPSGGEPGWTAALVAARGQAQPAGGKGASVVASPMVVAEAPRPAPHRASVLSPPGLHGASEAGLGRPAAMEGIPAGDAPGAVPSALAAARMATAGGGAADPGATGPGGRQVGTAAQDHARTPPVPQGSGHDRWSPGPEAGSAAATGRAAASELAAPDPRAAGEPALSEPDRRATGDPVPASMGLAAQAEVEGRLPAAAPPDPPATAQRIARQLAAHPVLRTGGSAEFRLAPEELGPLRLSVEVEGAGLRVVIEAARPETADLMRRHLETLRQELRQEGLGEVGVSIGGGESRTGGGAAPHRGPGDARPGPAAPPSDLAFAAPAAAAPRPRGAGGQLDLRF